MTIFNRARLYSGGNGNDRLDRIFLSPRSRVDKNGIVNLLTIYLPVRRFSIAIVGAGVETATRGLLFDVNKVLCIQFDVFLLASCFRI